MRKTITILIVIVLILVSGVILFKQKLTTNYTVTTTYTNPPDVTTPAVTTPVTTPQENNYIPYTVERLTHLVGEVPDGRQVQVVGSIADGNTVGSHCPNEVYIKDETGYIRLIMQGSEWNDSLGKKASIKGVYEWDICEALCICGPQITVSEIGNIE